MKALQKKVLSQNTENNSRTLDTLSMSSTVSFPIATHTSV